LLIFLPGHAASAVSISKERKQQRKEAAKKGSSEEAGPAKK
jgi:hypothetical protein